MNDPSVPEALPPYFQRLHELFDRVLELPAAEREAEVARISAEAPELAAELRALLEHAARSDSPLDSAAVSLQGELPPPDIPGFRLHQCIGRGGSATVYLADQEHAEFSRTVALKVVDRPFAMNSLRSVREEQRILARLEHPGIARLYDAGMTAAGQHWLAVEYVEGVSIVEHCNARELSARQRIELFLPVLEAVAYAHARGIVHRDLKPGNIFVTASGEPRLLDFGIARLADPTDPDETRTLQRALTPAYASPEQMHGGRITTASDIYSLGVVLYELLAGTLPRRPGSDEMKPLPASPEFERGAFRGDVEAVLGKALREQPEERYDSATAMAADLRNLLSGAPVAARRGERAYRARKFLRRHRGAIAVATLALVLVAGWQLAERWRDARPGNEVAIYHDAEPVDPETRRWLREGAERLARFDGLGARDSFRKATGTSKGRRPGEALAWDGVARAEGSLGEIGRAAEAARRAGALIAGHTDALPPLEAERLRARALAANGKWSDAIPALERSFSLQPERVDIGLDLVATLLACGRTDAADTALGRLRQLVPRNAASGDPRIDLAEAEVALQLSEYQRAAAAASRARGSATRAQAVVLGQRAARIHAEAIGLLDRREEAQRELAAIIAKNEALGLTGETAAARLSLAFVSVRSVPADEARRNLEAARAGCARAGDRRCEISARGLLAMVDGMEGKLTEAIGASKTANAEARAMGDRWLEGYTLSQLHVLYNWAEDPAAVEALNEPLLAALRDSGNRKTLSTTLVNLSTVAIEALDFDKAEEYLAEADQLTRRIGSQPGNAQVDNARGYLEESRGDLDLARKSYTAAVDKARQTGAPWALASYLADLAWLEVAADRPNPAAERAREAIAILNTLGDKQMAANTEGILAWSEARQGNAAAAERHLVAVRQAAEAAGSAAGRFNLLHIEAHVASASGDWPRAIELRRELIAMARQWNAHGVVLEQQAELAVYYHHAGDRAALEKLAAELLPELDRQGLRGLARGLREMLASPAGKS